MYRQIIIVLLLCLIPLAWGSESLDLEVRDSMKNALSRGLERFGGAGVVRKFGRKSQAVTERPLLALPTVSNEVLDSVSAIPSAAPVSKVEPSATSIAEIKNLNEPIQSLPDVSSSTASPKPIDDQLDLLAKNEIVELKESKENLRSVEPISDLIDKTEGSEEKDVGAVSKIEDLDETVAEKNTEDMPAKQEMKTETSESEEEDHLIGNLFD